MPPRLNERNSVEPYTMNTNEVLMDIPILKSSSLEKRLERIRKRLPYQTEYVKETFSDELWQAMEHRNLAQVAFAKQAKVPKQFLTRVFRGGNCTIETMVRLAFALNYKVNIHLTPNEVGCWWMHWLPEPTPRPPERFFKLWSESGYEPVESLRREVMHDTVALAS